ncbi:hypothetical protein MY3296_006362 [Beauveria thailandica]
MSSSGHVSLAWFAGFDVDDAVEEVRLAMLAAEVLLGLLIKNRALRGLILRLLKTLLISFFKEYSIRLLDYRVL